MPNMKMLKFLFLIFLIPCLGTVIFAQKTGKEKTNRVVLNGYVKDSLSGESLIGASIVVNGASKGVVSNLYGFYSITLPE
ncbi:MAG TPA: hypothetical protein PLG88_01880, partial [Chitinophagaceae bacterium]|nr:hypothetical protein [Chitinophagaceae bacterium]